MTEISVAFSAQGRAAPRGRFELTRHANDIDEVAARIGQVFRKVVDVRVPEEFRKSQHVVQKLSLKTVALRRVACGGFTYEAISHDRMLLGFSTQGGLRLDVGGSQVETKPFVLGEAIPPGQLFKLGMAPQSMLYLLEVPLADIAAQAEALLGNRLYQGAKALNVDLRSGAGAALVRNVLHMFHEIDSLPRAGESLAGLVSFEEHLLNMVICATRPDLVAQDAEGGVLASPVVQRAKDYLAARAAQPVRIAEVAAALSVSTRVLQLAFKQHVGCSPLEFLLQSRLELAHKRLLAAQPDDSVTSIARQSGFVNLGAFAQRYRVAYGDRPSVTLRRSQMRR